VVRLYKFLGLNSSSRGFMVTIAFVMWVCLYAIEMQFRLSTCVQFKDFSVLEDLKKGVL